MPLFGTTPGHHIWLCTDSCGLTCATITWTLHIFAWSTISKLVIQPWLGDTVAGALHQWAYSCCTLLSLASHAAAMLSDPGAVPPHAEPPPQDLARYTEGGGGQDWRLTERKRWCNRCGGFKPVRAHHDSVTGRCVVRLDHYCPWVNNAVGVRNHKFFLLFVIYTLLQCTYSLLLLVALMVSCTDGAYSGEGDDGHPYSSHSAARASRRRTRREGSSPAPHASHASHASAAAYGPVPLAAEKEAAPPRSPLRRLFHLRGSAGAEGEEAGGDGFGEGGGDGGTWLLGETLAWWFGGSSGGGVAGEELRGLRGCDGLGLLTGLVAAEALLFGLFTACMLCDQSALLCSGGAETKIDRLKGDKVKALPAHLKIHQVFGAGGYLRRLLPLPVHFPVSVRSEMMGFVLPNREDGSQARKKAAKAKQQQMLMTAEEEEEQEEAPEEEAETTVFGAAATRRGLDVNSPPRQEHVLGALPPSMALPVSSSSAAAAAAEGAAAEGAAAGARANGVGGGGGGGRDRRGIEEPFSPVRLGGAAGLDTAGLLEVGRIRPGGGMRASWPREHDEGQEGHEEEEEEEELGVFFQDALPYSEQGEAEAHLIGGGGGMGGGSAAAAGMHGRYRSSNQEVRQRGQSRD